MSDTTGIEWTDATWNPGQWGHGFATRTSKGGRWTGRVELIPDRLEEPMKWRKPRRIFVNSTSDLFHEELPDAAIDHVFAVMALCPRHTFQVLTKRPERMRAYLSALASAEDWPGRPGRIIQTGEDSHICVRFPLQNVWFGTSVEDQATANERIPHLLATPAAVRFVSAEPLLGPIDFTGIDDPGGEINALSGWTEWKKDAGPKLAWAIVGGESGPGARPMHPDWVRSIRNQCAAAGVPFFMKQMSGPIKARMPAIPEDLMVREFPT